MIDKEKKECSGCTACSNICSVNAITMVSDSLGFLYPEIDQTKCVQCGLCDKICQFNENYKRYNNFDIPIGYSLRLKDFDQLERSQSGGAFFALAKLVIYEGGVVYGAAFGENWIVSHQKVNAIDDLEKLRMSKYVQSDIRGVFKQVKDDLSKGLVVLFSGTSCQVAGLKSFIPNRLLENLLTIDIVCHGVPSPKIWDDYIYYLESKHKSKIIKACFRDKRFGWHGATETFKFLNGDVEVRKTFNHLYFESLSLRKSCSNCYYTNLKRVGDLSIGDFWGLPKDSPFEDDKGLSLLLVNSHAGADLLERVKDQFIIENKTLESCMQMQLKEPTKMNKYHEDFVRDYERNGFLYVAKKYGNLGWRHKLYCALKKIKQRIRLITK